MKTNVPSRMPCPTVVALCLAIAPWSASAAERFDPGRFEKEILVPASRDAIQMEVLPGGDIVFAEFWGAVKRWDSKSGEVSALGQVPAHSKGEVGLLGMAVARDFATSGHIYVVFCPAAAQGTMRVSRFTVADGKMAAESERTLLKWPYDTEHVFHMGGAMCMDAKGNLYIGNGDNCHWNPGLPVDTRPDRKNWDAFRSAANSRDLRGKILRIHPEPDGTYSNPKGNLFPGGRDGAPEIFGMGIRNPFRMSFDDETGTLYFGDGTYWAGSRVFPTRSMFAGHGTSSGGFAIPTDGTDVRNGATGAVTPSDIAFGPSGDLYLTDAGNLARVVSRVTPDGRYYKVAGGGTVDYTADGVPATSIRLGSPRAIDVGPDGSVYFTNTGVGGSRVFRISTDGRVYLVAGNPAGTFVDGMLAKDALLRDPRGVATSKDGSIYIADEYRILRVGTDGRITTYAGNGGTSFPQAEEGFLGRADSLAMQNAGEMVMDDRGNLLVLQGQGRIVTISPDNRMSAQKLRTRDGVVVFSVNSLCKGPDGAIYVSQNVGNGASTLDSKMSVYRVESDGGLTMVAGGLPSAANFLSQGPVLARSAKFQLINCIAVDRNGVLYIGEIGTGNSANGITRYAPELPSVQFGEIQVPSSDGREKYVFNSNGRHLRTLDARSGVTLFQFGYDAATGELTSITDADGLVTTIERSGGMISIHAPAPFGQTTVLQLDASGKYLASVANPNNESYQMTCDAGGLLRAFTNPRGKVWHYDYGASDGRLISEQAPGAPADKWLRFEQAESPTIRDVTKRSPEGRVTQYTIMRMLDGIRRHVLLRPDGVKATAVDSMLATGAGGDIEFVTSSTGETVRTFKAKDPRFGWIAPVDSVETTTLPVQAPAPSVVRTVLRTVRVAGSTLQESVTLNGTRYLSIYDTVTSSLITRTPAGRQSTMQFDAAGRLLSASLGGIISPVSFQYYAASSANKGRLSRVSQGSRAWDYTYDAKGRLYTVTDPLARTTTFAYDLADRVQTITLPGSHVVGYGYNANGDLVSLTPPGRPAHGYAYSDLDDLSGYTPPVVPGVVSPGTTFDHNWDRQLTTVHRPDGGDVVLSYHPTNGRLTGITQPGRSPMSFTYWDVAQGPAAPSGQLRSVTSPDSVTCSYDYTGPFVSRETWSGAVSGSLARTFDADFHERTETVTVGSAVSTVTSTYADLDGLLTTVAVSGQDSLNIHRRVADGLIDSTHAGPLAGGIHESRDYNAYGELANLRYRIGSTVLLQQSLTRDALGRVTDIAETVAGVSGPESRSTHYDYDAATGWLTRVRVDGVQVSRYEYDSLGVGNGNRTAEYGANDALVATASYDAQDRLRSYGESAYDWTAAGELRQRSRPGELLTTDYDALGHLVSATVLPMVSGTPSGNPGTTVVYLADGQGRRVARTVNGVRERGWLYRDGLSPVAELDGTGALLNRYVYGTSEHAPDLLVRAGVEYRVVTDHLGSIRMVVDAASGAVMQRLDYDAWGNLVLDTAPAFQGLGYVSGIQDRDTRLVRFGARDYEPGVGRWTAKDPVGQAGGANVFAYAEADPVNLVDPEGAAPIAPQSSAGSGMSPWDEALAATPSIPEPVVDAIAGFGDGASMGVTRIIRRFTPGESEVRTCTDAYRVAYMYGVVVQVAMYLRGPELRIGKNIRIAPWGNRTKHPFGERPHYHRSYGKGYGQGGGNHRPWEHGW
ncbi:MAG: PQQ-dependent sugar dehydrogenase [Candidatus Eisenbacteria bacterium]